jgi:1,4-alpha-glucan branching enzyme
VRGVSGIWEGFIPGMTQGHAYKYRVAGADGVTRDKADPFGVHAENAPQTASKVWPLEYDWNDDDWMAARGDKQRQDAPISIYEMHVGSWKRRRRWSRQRPLSYRELAGR